jgi:gamma-glutamylcyclotransferase (GGCT)/AIG2-like uncharacterized protein YtfP
VRFFFYGTLMDADLRRQVLGREIVIEPAVALGFRRVGVAGRGYPMLLPYGPGRVEGLLADMDDEAVRRLTRYEGPEYRTAVIEVLVKGGRLEASVFLCHPGIADDGRPWSLETWRRRHKRDVLRRVAQ